MDLIFQFDRDKDAKLREERGVSFEQVISILQENKMLDILEHPNKKKYSHQKVYVVELNNYIYLVPFVKNGNVIFLKTIIPNRKATRIYLKEVIEENCYE